MCTVSVTANLNDVFLLRFTDFFPCWCFKMSLQSHMGKHIDAFKRGFLFMTIKYLAMSEKIFLFSPSPFFPPNSNPRNDRPAHVKVWVRVRVCVCVYLLRLKHTQADPHGGFWCESDSGRGWKQPSQSEGTKLTQALCNRKTTSRTQTKTTKIKTVCEEKSC